MPSISISISNYFGIEKSTSGLLVPVNTLSPSLIMVLKGVGGARLEECLKARRLECLQGGAPVVVREASALPK